MEETYLQKAWGDSVDNVTMHDVREAIAATMKMDDEHGAFWVSIIEEEEEEEIVLEAHKDLTVTGIFSGTEEIKARFSNWQEIEELYELFLKKDFDKVKEILQANNPE